MISLHGTWAPDRYDRNQGGLVYEAKGVLPGPTSYLPWPKLSPLSIALPTGACKGAFAARTTAGNIKIFAGTTTALYEYVDATTWTDRTRLAGGAYAVPDGEFWSFAQFGDNLVAVNQADDVQSIAITAGSNFAALAGSPPKARFVKTVGDQIWLGGLATAPNELRFSGRNNITFWTIGQQDSDRQVFPEGGFITGLTTRQGGLVFQEGAVNRFQLTADRSIVQFYPIQNAVGLIAPTSLIDVGALSFYLSEEGFKMADSSGQVVAIGSDIVDNWFRGQVNYERIYSVIGAADPVHPRVAWIFPTGSNVTAYHDHILLFDYEEKKWTHDDFDGSYIFSGATAGYTLEGLDAISGSLDALTFSLDARFLQGGSPLLAAFDGDDKLGFYTGLNSAARVTTSTLQLIPGRRALVQGCHLYGDASAATVTPSTAERPQGSFTAGSASSVNAQGFVPMRSSGRLHRFQYDTAADASWSHISGLDPIVEADGER